MKRGAEVWIPRRFVGEESRVDDPVLIVGLQEELDYRGGAVWPNQRRIIEMPMAIGAPPQGVPEDQLSSSQAKRAWTRLIKQVYEADPLVLWCARHSR